MGGTRDAGAARKPTLAELVSLPDLARMKGVPYRTLFDDIMTLWTRDVTEGGGAWLIRPERRTRSGKMRVNLSMLRAAHPALFERRYMEPDDVGARLESLETVAREARELRNAQGARIRRLEHEVRELRSELGRRTTVAEARALELAATG